MPKKYPEQDVDLDRLCQAMRHARQALRYYREERREAVRQYVGAHWSEEGTRQIVPVNLLALYTSIVGRNLIAKSPRVMLSTFDRASKPAVSAMERWANREIESMRLAGTLQRVVLDALFSVGICKVSLASPADASIAGWNMQAGTPFAATVDLDDFVFDVHAKDFAEAGFIGHRFRAPLEVVRASQDYSAARKKLTATTSTRYNSEGDERLGSLGRGDVAGDSEEFEDFVDLWEVYIPRKRLVLTIAHDSDAGGPSAGVGGAGDYEPLRVQEWIGPDCGPYHVLGYACVPGNAMPKGPIQDLKDLHDLANNLFRKLENQAQRQKSLLMVGDTATDDGKRTVEANDGDAIRVGQPDKVREVSYGGPNQGNLVMFQQARDLFSWLAGNLDIMGGLSPQSKTASQDRMLNENSARSIADMQDRTIAFSSAVIKSLCWYWWHSPFQTMRTQYTIPGMPQYQTVQQVTPEQRMRARWTDLDIRVDPYSMQHSTPQSRAASLNRTVTQVIVPMLPLLQQQGIVFDLNAYLAKMAQYDDMPDLGEIVSIQEPPPDATTSQPDRPGMPAETTRNYVRESMPGRTRQGNDMNLMSSLMGVDPGGNPNGNGMMNQPLGA